MTSRNQDNFHCHCRIMSKSYDGGESFAHSDIYFDEALLDPVVAASLLRYRNTVYFSNPASKLFRINMTVRWSENNGESWVGSLGVWKGPSGYSCLTTIPGTQANNTFIGMVFEKGVTRYYESIAFVRLRLWNTDRTITSAPWHFFFFWIFFRVALLVSIIKFYNDIISVIFFQPKAKRLVSKLIKTILSSRPF